MEYSHEFIMPNDDIPFKMFIFEGKDGNYVREKHWHRSVEIFALFEGELRFFLNEKEYPLKPGEFMLVHSVPKGQPDHCASDTAGHVRKLLYGGTFHLLLP